MCERCITDIRGHIQRAEASLIHQSSLSYSSQVILSDSMRVLYCNNPTSNNELNAINE